MPEMNFSRGVTPHQPVNADALSDDIRKGRYFLLDYIPSFQPHILAYGTQGAPVSVPALPTAAAGQLDAIYLPGPVGMQYIEMHQTTAQTLMPLRHATKGLEIALDQVDNETVEYVPGGNHANNPLSYLAGTDPGLVVRADFEITNADGMDQFGVFIRKQENYATPTSFIAGGDPIYTDIALFGFAGAVANPNPLRLSTDLNNSGVAVTSLAGFTVADTTLLRLELRVQKRKLSTFINGRRTGERVSRDASGAVITAQNTIATHAFTFDTGDRLIGGIFIRQDALLSTVFLRRLEIGRPSEIGLDPSGR